MKFNIKNLIITNSYACYEVTENEVTTSIEVSWKFLSCNNYDNTLKLDFEIDDSVRFCLGVFAKIELTDKDKKTLFQMIQDEVEQDATAYGFTEWMETMDHIEYEPLDDYEY